MLPTNMTYRTEYTIYDLQSSTRTTIIKTYYNSFAYSSICTNS